MTTFFCICILNGRSDRAFGVLPTDCTCSESRYFFVSQSSPQSPQEQCFQDNSSFSLFLRGEGECLTTDYWGRQSSDMPSSIRLIRIVRDLCDSVRLHTDDGIFEISARRTTTHQLSCAFALDLSFCFNRGRTKTCICFCFVVINYPNPCY